MSKGVVEITDMTNAVQMPAFDLGTSPEHVAREVAAPRKGAVHRGPQMTEQAAALNGKLRSGVGRRKVLEVIAAAGPDGCTDYDLECNEYVGMRRPSPGNRRHELETWWNPPLVERRGDTRVIPATGNPAYVFRITEHGLAVLAVLTSQDI